MFLFIITSALENWIWLASKRRNPIEFDLLENQSKISSDANDSMNSNPIVCFNSVSFDTTLRWCWKLCFSYI